jgi:hypothetical protein
MTVFSWQTPLTAATAFEDNTFRRPVASVDRQPSTSLASFKENAIPFSSEPSTQELEAQKAIRTTVSKPISQSADGVSRNDVHGGPSILPESPRHIRDHLLSEANADRTAPSSTGKVYDVFTLYENEFGKIQTIRDAQKPRPSFTSERRHGVAAGGSTMTKGPGKQRKLSSLPDSGRSAKRSHFSPCGAPTVGHGPPPVNDDNQYAVECLLERRNRGCVTEYLVKWEGYGEEDHS